MFTPLRARPESRSRGFTLIEVLIVVVIIGILTAIASSLLVNQRKKAVDASLKSDARTIATQLEAAYTDGTGYPTGIGGDAPDLVIGSETVRTSPGNVVQVWLRDDEAQAFCVRVTNAQGGAPGTGHVWHSDEGGPQPLGADCAGYATAVL